MNKCKIYCSNYNCPWNSCFETYEYENCSENVTYEICSCSRYVDIPMKIVNVNGMTSEEFRADAIDLLENIAQALCGISDTLDGRCGSASSGCNNGCNNSRNNGCNSSCNNGCNNGCNNYNGCNGFNAYDTSNTPCGYTNVSGNYSYGCRGCGRCR